MSFALTNEASNRADWTLVIAATDADTGDDIDFTGAAVSFAVADSEGCRRLSATVDNGITVGGETVTVFFSADAMKALCAGTYKMGAVYQINGETVQLFIGTVTIVDGVASL